MNIRRLALIAAVAALVSCVQEKEVDVLIVGGGASGVSAGLQSARMGVSTMILEEGPWLGGMLTSAGVSCIDGNYKLRSGIFGEFLDSLAAHYGGYEALKTGWVSNVCFEPQVAQDIFTSMTLGCADALTVVRDTRVLNVAKGEKGWTVTCDGPDGKTRITADVLIDATELGDVAAACGVEYSIGMDSSSETGESIAPDHANDIIQDLTYVAVLKDYGEGADKTVPMPDGYDPARYADCCVNPLNVHEGKTDTGQVIWPAGQMLTYGALPGGKYMLNWPIYGNDYYVNVIEMTPAEREKALVAAKNMTLGYVYFIQTELGMKHLGIADDVFPTEDGLAIFPYHRESRRIKGEAFFTVDAAARPYEYRYPYYRTGIAVGDYAVDQHHFRHPQWQSLPDLHFYPIPSFNVPMGSLIPAGIDDLIVAEKSISVSNLMNGATRLQPVVMQLGQAAGALAALAVKRGVKVRYAGVRNVQQVLLEAGCYIMPYLDLPKDHPHFQSVQRIGAVGMLRGEGRNVGWSNQTWFRAGDPLLSEDIHISDLYSGSLPLPPGEVSVKSLIAVMRSVGFAVPADEAAWWESLGLDGFDASRTVTRLEAAVVIDKLIDPFSMFGINLKGEVLNRY